MLLITVFCKLLNTHGYAFHYAVLRKAAELCEKRRSAWTFIAAEYPVAVNAPTQEMSIITRL